MLLDLCLLKTTFSMQMQHHDGLEAPMPYQLQMSLACISPLGAVDVVTVTWKDGCIDDGCIKANNPNDDVIAGCICCPC